jgi:hypothetical protein
MLLGRYKVKIKNTTETLALILVLAPAGVFCWWSGVF